MLCFCQSVVPQIHEGNSPLSRRGIPFVNMGNYRLTKTNKPRWAAKHQLERTKTRREMSGWAGRRRKRKSGAGEHLLPRPALPAVVERERPCNVDIRKAGNRIRTQQPTPHDSDLAGATFASAKASRYTGPEESLGACVITHPCHTSMMCGSHGRKGTTP